MNKTATQAQRRKSMKLTPEQIDLLRLVRHEQDRAGRCPCRGSNDMCGCQNRIESKEQSGER